MRREMLKEANLKPEKQEKPTKSTEQSSRFQSFGPATKNDHQNNTVQGTSNSQSICYSWILYSWSIPSWIIDICLYTGQARSRDRLTDLSVMP